MQASLLLDKQDNRTISEELKDLLHSIGSLIPMHKGTYLFHEGTEAERIYLLKSGLVHIGKLTTDGKELSLRICQHKDIVGELTLFCKDPKYFLSAKVIESGEVFAIDKGKLEKKLLTSPELTFEFMTWTSNHMRKFQTKIRDLLLNGKKGALYSTLIRLSNSYGKQKPDGVLIDMALTNQELAKFCAATRESVNRMLVDLRKADIIDMNKHGKILIKDIQYLRNEIGCENCPIEICNIN